MADEPHKEFPETESPRSDPHQQHEEPVPISRTETQVPVAVINQTKSQKQKRECRQRWKFRLEVITIIVITSYTIIAGVQACQMRRATETATESTELLRQQLVGTQAANVALHLDIFGNDGLRVMFDRRGVVAAKDVRFEFTAVRKDIRTLKDIEAPIHRIAYEETISPEQFHPPKEFSLPGFTPAVLEAIRKTEQTIMVTGEFSYNNGFDDVPPVKICKYWLSGIPNSTTGQGGANEFVSCEDFPIRLNNVLKAR